MIKVWFNQGNEMTRLGQEGAILLLQMATFSRRWKTRKCSILQFIDRASCNDSW